MKIYIAGSISNNPDYVEQFQNAEDMLKADGHEVINPAKNSCFSYKHYVDTGLFELMHCDAIYLLKGFENSKGALLEQHYAEVAGIKAIYQ